MATKNLLLIAINNLNNRYYWGAYLSIIITLLFKLNWKSIIIIPIIWFIMELYDLKWQEFKKQI